MTVTDIHKDAEALTMTITTEFDAPIARVWQLWENPRQLERWWGPPTYPATFVEHDLKLGGAATYYMTGPEGERHGGWWRVIGIDAPHRLEFEDGFADESGKPNPEMPTTTIRVDLSEQPDGRTRMAIERSSRRSMRWSRWSPWAWKKVSKPRSVRSTSCCNPTTHRASELLGRYIVRVRNWCPASTSMTAPVTPDARSDGRNKMAFDAEVGVVLHRFEVAWRIADDDHVAFVELLDRYVAFVPGLQ